MLEQLSPPKLPLHNINAGSVAPVVLSTPYHSDPLATFASLRKSEGEHLLLESAEIDSRENLKSLMLIDASLRLVCSANTVLITPLSDNGKVIIDWLCTVLPAEIEQQLSNDGQLKLTILPPSPGLNERERLLAISNLEPLRILQQQLKTTRAHPFGIFLGGVFAYDLLASFEPLVPVAEGENHCPDYQYYLAETLLVIDHQQQTAELIGSLPGGHNINSRHQQLCQRMGEIVGRLQFPAENTMSVPSHLAPPPELVVTPS